MGKKKKGQNNYIVFQCYSMEKIADAASPPDEASYRELYTKFNLRLEDMVRPDEIDLLNSMRRNIIQSHSRPRVT